MSKSHDKMLCKARRLLNDGHTSEWDEITDALDGLDLNDPADLAVRGRCRLEARRFDGAIADLEAAVSGGVDHPEVHFGLGGALSTMAKIENLAAAGHTYRAHAAKGDPHDTAERAIDCLRNAVLLLPDSATATYALCEELEGLGRYGGALSVLRAYKKFDRGRNRFIYRHMGRIYGRQRKWRLSYANYVRSVWLIPSKSGEHERVKQRHDQITRIHRRFMDLDHESYDSFLHLAIELLQVTWHDVVIDVIGTAALMKPSPQLYLMIGEIYTSQLRLNEAIDNYKEGIQNLSGKCPPADLAPLYEALVVTLVKCARGSEAREYGSESVSLGVDGDKLRTYWKAASTMSDGFDPLAAGWISPSYVDRPLRITIRGRTQTL